MFNTILYFFKNINSKLFLKLNIYYTSNLNLIKNNLILFISIFYQSKNIKLNKLKFYFFFQKNQIFNSILLFLFDFILFIILLEIIYLII